MKIVIGSILILILQLLMIVFGAGIYFSIWTNPIGVLGLILFTVSVDVITVLFIIDKFFYRVS
ncbi:hypothetical protein [uncultured Clostridium sp.]|uniref:hypothetical protein n=1 Tax=uncultured Clostridium sp. TaxID=59620 RepID=UPI00263A28FA|nr:hypothetical protein [uncultured Clostridium sp.]